VFFVETDSFPDSSLAAAVARSTLSGTPYLRYDAPVSFILNPSFLCLKKYGQSGYGDTHQPKEEKEDDQKEMARRKEQ
jgi:hypothetical protein